MEISVEISYYPLREDYDTPVLEFIRELEKYPNLKITPGMMSSIITGEYANVMDALSLYMQPFLEKYPSVFKLTVASACKSCEV